MTTQARKQVYKLVLCGDYGVGKSSLFRRFVFDTFVESSDRKCTLGFDHFEKTYPIDDKCVTLQLWDTGGLERVATVTSSYFKFSNGVLLVFAYDDMDSLNDLSQHLVEALTCAEQARYFLCGNKADLYNEHNGYGPNEENVNLFCQQSSVGGVGGGSNLFSRVYKVSCKTNENVDEMFKDIARQLSVHGCHSAAPDPEMFRLKAVEPSSSYRRRLFNQKFDHDDRRRPRRSGARCPSGQNLFGRVLLPYAFVNVRRPVSAGDRAQVWKLVPTDADVCMATAGDDVRRRIFRPALGPVVELVRRSLVVLEQRRAFQPARPTPRPTLVGRNVRNGPRRRRSGGRNAIQRRRAAAPQPAGNSRLGQAVARFQPYAQIGRPVSIRRGRACDVGRRRFGYSRTPVDCVGQFARVGCRFELIVTVGLRTQKSRPVAFGSVVDHVGQVAAGQDRVRDRRAVVVQSRDSGSVVRPVARDVGPGRRPISHQRHRRLRRRAESAVDEQLRKRLPGLDAVFDSVRAGVDFGPIRSSAGL
ncbi:Ras-related protein ARA-5 [Trichinella spiralis]|uniref:Ras-related protein ARA-5 n=1 Tax=Trichinella spiralis TaxID=6334 RepID=UPI0001EFDF3C|nr:Ras-related protein ARA-5 [Trichinella spiralis]